MKTQSNKIVMLEWLLPLLDQQLSQASAGWQHSSDLKADSMSANYRQIASTLIMANLPRLGHLSDKLSQLSAADEYKALTVRQKRLGHFAHQLLRNELVYYVQTGNYRRVLIDSTTAEIVQTLSAGHSSTDNHTIDTRVLDFDEYYAQSSISNDSSANSLIKRVDRIIPKHSVRTSLQAEQYQQLLLVWRQQIQQLLTVNDNQPSILQPLIKVSHYLWQAEPVTDAADAKADSQRLWYLTELWLSSLIHNKQPLPIHYAQLLSRLEQVLESYTHQKQVSAIGQSDFVERLITDIYVQLSSLTTIDDDTQAKLSKLASKADISLRFLPRVLADLETIVFGLDHPQTLIEPLQQLKSQLERRGWLLYESKVDQILVDLNASMSSEATFAQMQWQIESQLQELYSSIYNTEQSIYTNIGTLSSFNASPNVVDTVNDQQQTNDLVAASHDDYLKQLRLVFTSIKLNFVDYVEHKPNTVLSTVKAFTEINTILADMELFSLQKISDQLDGLFAQIAEHEIENISWELMQALTTTIAILERLLDYLTQQVLDKYLVQQAYDQIELAQTLLAARLASADTDDDIAAHNFLMNKSATNVLRYDDSGEIAAINDLQTTSAANIETDTISNGITSNQVDADELLIDDDARSSFVEQAMEITIDLQDFFPIWEEESEDSTALTEVKRNFYALQELAQRVNANDISTLTGTLEQLLEQVLQGTLAVSEDLVALVAQSLEQLPILVADFLDGQAPSIDLANVLLQKDNLLAGLPLSIGMNTDNSGAQFVIEDSLTLKSDTDNADNFNDIKEITETADDDSDENKIAKASDVEFLNADSESNETPVFIATNTESFLDLETQTPVELSSFIEQAAPMPTDGDAVDPDIKEIFIEEAEEVLAEITPLYDQWRENTSELTKLKEVRRGFHTLKGSGRMVGANYSAELAWSIENLVNQILDRVVPVSIDIELLIKDVLSAYPQLIATFAEDRKDYPANSSIWVACANAYSQRQADDFSYSEWRDQGLISSQVNSDYSSVATEDNNSNANTTLQTIHFVNEIMAEATVVVAPQSEEEQAFYEIFSEEAHSLLQEITDFVQTHEDQGQVEVSDQIVRAFHTLRAASGSSALVAISEVSATIEHSLEQLQQCDIPMTPQHLQALTQSVTLIEGYLSSYDKNVQQSIANEDPQSHQDLVSLQAILDESEELPVVVDSLLEVTQLLDLGIDALLDAEWQLNEALNTESLNTKSNNGSNIEISTEDLQRIHTYIRQMRQQIAKLSAKTGESPKFVTLLTALNNAYEYLDHNPTMAINPDIQRVLLNGHAQLVGLFDALAGSMSLKVDSQVVDSLYAIGRQVDQPARETLATNFSVQSTPARKVHSEVIDTDSELLEIFLQEAQEVDSAIAETFNDWRTDIYNKDIIKKLQRYVHTIKGGAQMSSIRSMGQLTHEITCIYESFVEGRIKPTEQWVEVMQKVQEVLSLQIGHVLNHQQSFFATELIQQWREFEHAGKLPAQVNLILPAPKDQLAIQPLAAVETARQDVDTDHQAVNMTQLIADSWLNGQPDPDILEVYLEEADELISSSSKHLQQFLNDDSDVGALQSLQRDLHTIKGGARMVAANGIADLAHEMETVYEELANHRYPATQMASKLLIACHDWIVDAIFVLRQQVNPLIPTALIASLKQLSANPDSLEQIPNESLDMQRNAILATKAKRKPQQLVKSISQMPLMTGSFAEQVESVSSTEMIRISGSLVEHMINLSGESAINRARIDMGMTSLTNSIEEMGTTVQRLADQLRRMEVELEVQILSQIDEDLIDNEDFDPLEMDQYSSLNQLSKSLSESASDLVDINSTLLEKTRDSESLLLQLSRTQTELQDGLMKSRIVPFTRLTPRLERIVRQTANELNKSVNLTIINADDEMDRNILERITSPLEHMLRNAVDHGIEETQTRLEAGKDSNGNITLEVLREGSEVIIRLSDDGRGIDVEAVREKAIAKGLIDSNDDTLSDLDVMQYIFNAGLSTTEQLTQISGRGVGMDVVISEVRQLGGIVSVSSKPGLGSQFTMRVPLSVAITDALVVRVADSYYAIPLVQIERVVRINPEKIYDYYQSGAATLAIEDNEYRVRYLNEILSGNKFNELMVNTNTSLPLIIIKSRTGQNLALQVDQIAGSRIEVVVKPLGRQLSHIAGISAATIMGDGSVMFILDLIALMRNAPSQRTITSEANAYELNAEVQPTVLVVDDSVTVRKVTSRFLERQGIKVLIAKDGVDAVDILQETIPDLILLDIEMPRMDGFEVATQIRHSKRLKHIPIIMITSRTGEKHRERAFAIGVDDYMGKPFQEKQLLKKIQLLLGSKVSLDYEG